MKRHILILFAFYAGLWLQAANEENIVYTNASNLQLITPVRDKDLLRKVPIA